MCQHLSLTSERQLLFEEHRSIARSEARRFLARNRGNYDRLEVEQASLTGLWQSCFYWKPELAKFTFGAYATIGCRRGITAYYFGHVGLAPSSAASRNAAKHNFSGSEPSPSPGQPEYTVMDCAVDRVADRELSASPGEDRLASRLFELREAIRTLTPRERRVLRLRYVEGLEREAIAAKIGLSRAVIHRTISSGVKKLRTYFAAKGLKTLPLAAPVPYFGNQGRPHYSGRNG